jgi:hypothetical protein
MCRNEDSATIGRVALLFWCIWKNGVHRLERVDCHPPATKSQCCSFEDPYVLNIYYWYQLHAP